MPKRSRTPKVELIEYNQLKAAAGGSGASGGGSFYRQGQNLRCKILSKTNDGGYDVLILEDNVRAFLKTGNDYEDGEEALAMFVCVHKSRIVLTQMVTVRRHKTSS